MPWPARNGETYLDDTHVDEQPHAEQQDDKRMHECASLTIVLVKYRVVRLARCLWMCCRRAKLPVNSACDIQPNDADLTKFRVHIRV